MLVSVGRMGSRFRTISSYEEGGGESEGGSVSRSETSDSNHVHTMSSLNTLFMIPNVHYISQAPNDNTENYSVKDVLFTSGSNASHTFYLKKKNYTVIPHFITTIYVLGLYKSTPLVK